MTHSLDSLFFWKIFSQGWWNFGGRCVEPAMLVWDTWKGNGARKLRQRHKGRTLKAYEKCGELMLCYPLFWPLYCHSFSSQKFLSVFLFHVSDAQSSFYQVCKKMKWRTSVLICFSPSVNYQKGRWLDTFKLPKLWTFKHISTLYIWEVGGTGYCSMYVRKHLYTVFLAWQRCQASWARLSQVISRKQA